MAATRATLIAGFLGAGKSTLLSRLLASDLGERVAVLLNDFGEVSIDAALITGVEDGAITLANGCVCCTIQGDLIAAVQRVLRRDDPPRRIVVELSGVSDPGAVVRSFLVMQRSWPVDLDGVITVADCAELPLPGEPHHELAREQLAAADLVVLNKIDRVGAARRKEVEDAIRSWLGAPRILPTSHGVVPLEALLGIASPRAPLLADPEQAPVGHTHDHDFATYTWRGARPLSLERLRALCVELPPSVLRAKGVLWLAERADTRVVLQVVGRRARVDLGTPWGDVPPSSTVVFVGTAQGVDGAALGASLTACEAGAGGPGLLDRAREWLRARR